MDGNLVVAVLGVAAGFGVFLAVMLIGREVVTWYWKVNEGLAKLSSIEAVLRNIDKNLVEARLSATRGPQPVEGQVRGVGS